MGTEPGTHHDARLVDWHAHFMPAGLEPPTGADHGWPVARAHAGEVQFLIGERLYRRVDSRSCSATARIDDLPTSIAHQVVSPPPFALSALHEASELADFCRQINELTAANLGPHPDKFSRFIALPVGPTPEHMAYTAKEVERWRGRAGVAGACLVASLHDHLLDDGDWFWELMGRTGWMVFVHPSDQVGKRVGEHPFGHVMPSATGLFGARLLTSGVLDRWPSSRVLLSHAGGTLPSLVDRIEEGWRLGLYPQLEQSPLVGVRNSIWADTVAYSERVLTFALEILGPDRLVFGSDYPFRANVMPDSLSPEILELVVESGDWLRSELRKSAMVWQSHA